MQLRLANALNTQQIAQTYPAEAPQCAKVMRRAVDEFQTLHKTYQRNLAGLYARASAADCYQDLGEYEEALAIYGEMLELPLGQAPLDSLKKRSIWRAMTCWLAQGPPDFKNAIWQGFEWLKEAQNLAADDPAEANAVLAEPLAVVAERYPDLDDPDIMRVHDTLMNYRDLLGKEAKRKAEFDREKGKNALAAP